jgi:uncharacterized protein YdiU (UPF0061 family)
MLVGFVHGVMNTDNTAISGETIDYGPCAFIDAYDPAAVFSSIDHGGRYAYGNQPAIAGWNLTRFAETLLPLLGDGFDNDSATEADPETAKRLALDALGGFGRAYDAAWLSGMRQKLGIGAADRSGLEDEYLTALAAAMLGELRAHRIDYTRFFRALGEAARGREDGVRELFDGPAGPGEWFAEWLELSPDADEMDRANPVYVPRNHLVDEALAAAESGNLAPFERMLGAVTRPFLVRSGLEAYALPAPPGSDRHVTFCGT